MNVRILFNAVLFMVCLETLSQHAYPYKSYEPEEFGRGRKVLCIDQAADGRIFLGTSAGLKMNHYGTWKTGNLPKQPAVIWMDIDDENERVYVGSYGEFGYFDFDLNYISLSDRIQLEVPEVGTVWEVAIASDGVYFRTTKKIYWYNQDRITTIDWEGTSTTPFDILFNVNDTIYTRIKGAGFCQLVDGKITVLSPDLQVKSNVFLEHPEGILIATRKNGFFIYSPEGLWRWETMADAFVTSNPIYYGTKLKNGNYAFATLSGGVIIMNARGEIVHTINAENYKMGEGTVYVFEDAQEGLWIGNQVGLMRVEMSSPIRELLPSKIIEFSIFSVWQDTLYFGSTEGLYAWSEGFAEVQRVKGAPNLISEVRSTGRELYTSNTSETHFVAGLQATRKSGLSAKDLTWIEHEKWDYMAGLGDEMVFFKKLPDGRLTYEILKDAPSRIFQLKQHQGLIWGASSTFGLFTYDFSDFKAVELEGFRFLIEVKNELIAVLDTGFAVLDTISRSFKPHERYNRYLPEKFKRIHTLNQQDDKYWLLYYDENEQFTGEVYQQDSLIHQLPLFQIYFGDALRTQLCDDLLYIAHNKGMLTYDLNKGRSRRNQEVKIASTLLSQEVHRLPYSKEPLRFDFSSTFIPSFSQNAFQYKIEGYREEWSDWSPQSYVEIANLYEGDYTIRVRARTPYRDVSEAALSFTIAPPMHRTWWAYVSYGVSLVLAVLGIVKWRSSYLEDAKKKLEAMVRDRTTEIASKNSQLKEALVEREALIKEVHHRVKNNLQIISSIFNMNLKEVEGEEVKKLILDGQSRLKSMSLIHQRLYQSENIKQIRFDEYATELLDQASKMYSGNKKIDASVIAQDIVFDTETAIPLGLILNELITNSFKYAFDEVEMGQIKVDLKQVEEDKFEMVYADNGRGMPETFNLETATSTGLKLVNILTRQLRGTISLENKSGAQFRIQFKAI